MFEAIVNGLGGLTASNLPGVWLYKAFY